MNEREFQFFSPSERRLADCTALPASYLLKSLFIKIRRRLWGRFVDSGSRFIWSETAVTDVHGPASNVRNYLDQKTIRSILSELTQGCKLLRACEIGCGYGRVIMVLKEFADSVKGFERENHLLEIACSLLPEIEFECVESVTRIQDERNYDLVMSCTLLQHLTDADAEEVCRVMKRLAPKGHLLCLEKTGAIATTANIEDGEQFISRARSIDVYKDLMQPYELVAVQDRVVEPTYFSPHAGTVMVFKSPLAVKD